MPRKKFNVIVRLNEVATEMFLGYPAIPVAQDDCPVDYRPNTWEGRPKEFYKRGIGYRASVWGRNPNTGR